VEHKRPAPETAAGRLLLRNPKGESRMSDKLQRMLAKAKAKRRKRPSDAILIDCERPEDVPARVDVLIAAGTLTEADRTRCAFWPDPGRDRWDGTRDEWVLMAAKNMTPEDLERLRNQWVLERGENTTPEDFQHRWDELIEDARAAVLAAGAADDGSAKKQNRASL
jgi:hypothetical protein